MEQSQGIVALVYTNCNRRIVAGRYNCLSQFPTPSFKEAILREVYRCSDVYLPINFSIPTCEKFQITGAEPSQILLDLCKRTFPCIIIRIVFWCFFEICLYFIQPFHRTIISPNFRERRLGSY